MNDARRTLRSTHLALLALSLALAFATGCGRDEPNDVPPPTPPPVRDPVTQLPPPPPEPAKPTVKIAFVNAALPGESAALRDVHRSFSATLDEADTDALDYRIEFDANFADDAAAAGPSELATLAQTRDIGILVGGATAEGANRIDEAARIARIPALLAASHTLDGDRIMPWTVSLTPPLADVARGMGKYALDRFRGQGFGVMIDVRSDDAFDLAEAFISGVVPYAPADTKLPQPFVGKRTFETGGLLAASPDDVLRRLKFDGAGLVFVAADSETLAAVVRANQALQGGGLTLIAVAPVQGLQQLAASGPVTLAVPLSLTDAQPGRIVTPSDLFAAAGHDLAQMALSVLQRSPSERPSDLRDAATRIRDLQGRTGVITMNALEARPINKAFLIGAPDAIGGLRVEAQGEAIGD